MKYYLILCVFFISIISGCGSEKEKIPVPVSFLGHVDIILDTTTIRQIAEDEFMMKTFGISNFDTLTLNNQKSYDMFLIGRENFLHFSQAREFYQNQQGGVNLIFQSKKPDMKDSLMNTWKKFTDFALDVNISSGTGFTLYEIMPLYSMTNVAHPRVMPVLSTYSTESYRTMGFADSLSTGVGMRTFLSGWGSSAVLFDKITEVHLNATSKELEVLKSGLFAAGYTEDGSEYELPGSATVFVTVNENENLNRLVSLKFALSRVLSEPYEKTFNRLKVSFEGNTGWFIYQ
jgi:hypothetical protein